MIIRRIRENIFKILTVALLGLYCMHTSSCANTSGAPTGGPKDTIPPVIVELDPDSNAINVPVHKTEITITFNEYVQLKDASKNIFLSPPQKKRPESKIKGKSVVVTFPEDLDSNRTYALNFGMALADNNEGNALPNYVYSFSTGNSIDSMLISGTILDYTTLLPQEGISIALYEQPKDSSVFNTLPDAVTKSDLWGYFCLRNLKPVPYALYAFKDENNNNLYDPGIESVGFSDSLVTPVVVMQKGMPQMANYDMKDTVACLERPSQMDVYIFNEVPTTQYISEYKRTTRRGAYITFGAPNVIIDSFSIRGLKNEKIIKQFNETFDSLAFWINESSKLPDTLYLGIKYHKTDTLGKLVPTVENLKLVAPFEKDPKAKDKNKNVSDGPKEREDLLKFTLGADPKMVEQNGYTLEFTEPVIQTNFDSIRFTMSTPRGVVTQEELIFEQDSTNVRKYTLRPKNNFKAGNDYELIIPTATFKDINGFTNDSTYNKLILPSDDKLSSITLDMVNVNARYIVELVDDKRTNVYRKYIISEDQQLAFPYLDKGLYSIRITEDKNSNGLLDTGSILEKRQPEMVRLYKLENGEDIITLEEKTDLEQTIDVEILFSGKATGKITENATENATENEK